MKTQLNVVIVALIICGIAMIYLGVKNEMPPPTITGIGFFFAAWGFQILKKRP